MKYEAFQEELRLAGLSAKRLAELLRLNANSITNYKRAGVVPSHLAVIAALLHTLKEHQIDHATVFDRLAIEPKAPRGRPEALKRGPHTSTATSGS